jgi:FO synthase subunit 2
MIAVSRLYLDNVDNIQTSWVKFGDAKSLKTLSCGANDFMGTILSEEITTRAGGTHGQFRSFDDYVEMVTAVGRTPAERSTDYRTVSAIDPADGPHGPTLGQKADGTPLLTDRERRERARSVGAAGD